MYQSHGSSGKGFPEFYILYIVEPLLFGWMFLKSVKRDIIVASPAGGWKLIRKRHHHHRIQARPPCSIWGARKVNHAWIAPLPSNSDHKHHHHHHHHHHNNNNNNNSNSNNCCISKRHLCGTSLHLQFEACWVTVTIHTRLRLASNKSTFLTAKR